MCGFLTYSHTHTHHRTIGFSLYAAACWCDVCGMCANCRSHIVKLRCELRQMRSRNVAYDSFRTVWKRNDSERKISHSLSRAERDQIRTHTHNRVQFKTHRSRSKNNIIYWMCAAVSLYLCFNSMPRKTARTHTHTHTCAYPHTGRRALNDI